ncbi:hypothetical protein RUM43_004623 [Polyplax serrata]|uniref:CCDC113/CCDC96 coiled-coil domain-containing protein n=1 Tax=Polyplax serrata TaxID=468196 RepID=A0AAN8XM77_POLSC
MSDADFGNEKSDLDIAETESEGKESYLHGAQEYGEDYGFEGIPIDAAYEEPSEEGEAIWAHLGEYGEAKPYYIYPGEAAELPSLWGEHVESVHSIESVPGEEEEGEEEKELRREREMLIDEIKHKIIERLLLRRRNAFLQKKLVELFKKRRIGNILKEEPKAGLDLDGKYLKRLYAFKEFKQAQEKEIEDLTLMMQQYEEETKLLEEELQEKLKSFMTRAKEVSLNLILSKSGKKINEKTVDRLLRRQLQKNAEKGKKKLLYIKVKKLIEEKERQLKAMEYFGDGLHIADYEQMKVDNQNYTDKIEEKEEELAKLRAKTQGIIQNLAHVREKAYAVGGDIELMEEKVYAVENTLTETRERLTYARKRRDYLREEFSRLKSGSGLLTKSGLLRDFEHAISQVNILSRSLSSMKRAMLEKNKQESALAKMVKMQDSNITPAVKIKQAPKSSTRNKR